MLEWLFHFFHILAVFLSIYRSTRKRRSAEDLELRKWSDKVELRKLRQDRWPSLRASGTHGFEEGWCVKCGIYREEIDGVRRRLMDDWVWDQPGDSWTRSHLLDRGRALGICAAGIFAPT